VIGVVGFQFTMPGRIADDELRQRLEAHNYNVPPITDTTRSILVKKLRQLDLQKKQRPLPAGIDYSSAEEDFTPPASSTKKFVRPVSGSRVRAKNGSSATSAKVQTSFRDRTPSSQTMPRTNTVVKNGNSSLMNHSEEEEEEEDEEEDEEDDSEDVDEDSDAKFEDYEEEVSSASRADFAIQTSFGSPEAETRFRGKTITPSKNAVSAGPSYALKSPHLRNNLDKFGSLNEALSTLPTNKSPPQNSKPQSSFHSPVTQVSRSAVRQPYNRKENKGSSMVVSSIIIVGAVMFFLALGCMYANLKSESPQRTPLCTGAEKERINIDCIPGHQLNSTAELLKVLLKTLKEEKSCLEPANQLHSFSDLKKALALETGPTSSEYEALLQNILILFKLNPSWGIEPVYEESVVTHLAVVDQSAGILCRLQYVIYAAIGFLLKAGNYILLLAIFVAVAWPTLKLWRRYKERKEVEKKDMFSLVERVLSMLQEHHQSREGQTPTYIAIYHIRDQLIAPMDRETKSALWNKAVEYIRKHESRVREEVQLIRGEEFRVWQWLPDLPLSPTSKVYPQRTPTAMPRSTLASPSRTFSPATNGRPDDGRGNMKVEAPLAKEPWPYVPTSSPGSPGWQGSAFNRHASGPVEPPTSCLKVRYMFDHNHLEHGWINSLKRDIIARCSDARILHIAVDQESREGVVYIKTKSTEDAGLVFKYMNGQWYKNQLVTAKYLRVDRYHQRFPDSIPAEHPLKN